MFALQPTSAYIYDKL